MNITREFYTFCLSLCVNAGFVPRVDNFPALARAAAQGFRCGSFDDGDVMGFLFPCVRLAQPDVSEVMAAQIELEKMAGGDGLPTVIPALGIVGGGVLLNGLKPQPEIRPMSSL